MEGEREGHPPVNQLRTTSDDWRWRSRRMTDQEWRLTTKNDWPQSIFTTTTTPAPPLTMQRVRALCYFVFCISAPFSDLWERVRVHLVTYESEWKFPIVLPDVNTLWDKFSVKRRVCMQILAHETMTVSIVSNTISQSFIQRDVSLQNYIDCNTWRRASFH